MKTTLSISWLSYMAPSCSIWHAYLLDCLLCSFVIHYFYSNICTHKNNVKHCAWIRRGTFYASSSNWYTHKLMVIIGRTEDNNIFVYPVMLSNVLCLYNKFSVDSSTTGWGVNIHLYVCPRWDKAIHGSRKTTHHKNVKKCSTSHVSSHNWTPAYSGWNEVWASPKSTRARIRARTHMATHVHRSQFYLPALESRHTHKSHTCSPMMITNPRYRPVCLYEEVSNYSNLLSTPQQRISASTLVPITKITDKCLQLNPDMEHFRSVLKSVFSTTSVI